jgi:hypothetical protein
MENQGIWLECLIYLQFMRGLIPPLDIVKVCIFQGAYFLCCLIVFYVSDSEQDNVNCKV